MTDDKDLARIQLDLLDLADFAHGRLAARLDGLTDEEYLWEPAEGCWSIRLDADGTYRADTAPRPVEPAPLTTIAWRVCHLIDVLADERNATWLGVAPAATFQRGPGGEPATAVAATDALERAFALFRAHVAAAGPAGLVATMGPVAGPYADSTRAAFVLHELDELIHHAAEVAAMRDMYRVMRPLGDLPGASGAGG